jgi:hypothetical protein
VIQKPALESTPRSYFVDEAGDGTLFDARGRVLIGHEGCSRYFMLGLLDLPNPEPLRQELEELRAQLMADPYFKQVPSMQPEAKKTALAFHAKDDLPEVRREVFTLLLRHQVHFYAVVKSKASVLGYVRQQNQRDAGYRYNANELYDLMVRRLFKDRLHQSDSYSITFAKRGKADRTEALLTALKVARTRFSEKWGVATGAKMEIQIMSPPQSVGLQSVDYFLWSLQRCYERREDRFLSLLWPNFSLVQDVDDTREAAYGRYYTQKKPLTAAALGDLPGI